MDFVKKIGSWFWGLKRRYKALVILAILLTVQKINLELTPEWERQKYDSAELYEESVKGGFDNRYVFERAKAQGISTQAEWDAFQEQQRLEQERKAEEERLAAEAEKQRLLAERDALTSPDWQPTDKMPKEWGRMHRTDSVAKEKGRCFFQGPETNVMFHYTNPEKGLWYLLSNFPPPPGVSYGTMRTAVVVEMKKVWVSSKNPNLYLSIDSNGTFGIDLIEDGFTVGQNKTLDGQPWSLAANIMTKYNAADYRRWAVDVNNSEPYQSQPNEMCPPETYANWLDVRFELKGTRSGTATLRQIMR